MSGMGGTDFAFVAAPVGEEGLSDAALYKEILADCEFAHRSGYRAAWMIEHHFSDYFPTPNPLAFLSHIAARFPDFALGTCVLVTPWYEPLRLAEEIAQLNLLTDQPLHLGLGRGTAKYEYDAFGVAMEESRQRFREVWEIVSSALAGGRFRYQGEYLNVPTRVELRPRSDTSKINFYGAVGGSPESGAVMASLGLPPIMTAFSNLPLQREALSGWKEAAETRGMDVNAFRYPMMVNCIIADEDEEAYALAKRYIPRFQQAQIDHYEADDGHFETLSTYTAWAKIFAKMKERTDPANIPPWADGQFVGSPETVRRRVADYVDAGFNSFLIHTATPGVPRRHRQAWLGRFADEVAPYFAGGEALRAAASA